MARLSEKLAQHGQRSAPVVTLEMGVLQRPILTLLPLDQIEPDPEQPRKDLGELADLAASIRELGVIQPIVVTVAGEERYRILAGERRYAAARLAGLEKLFAIVRTVEEHQRLQLQIVENLHRKDLTPFEEAQAYQALIDQFSLTQEAIAQRLGRSQESVSETLSLLSLPDAIHQGFVAADPHARSRISKSLLVELARLPEGEQEVLWEQARRGELTVKRLRAARKPAQASPAFRYPIPLEDGITVAVHFEGRTEATPAQVVAALKKALALAKRST